MATDKAEHSPGPSATDGQAKNPGPAGRTPVQKQGIRAAENYVANPSGFRNVGANRLVVHAVQDHTLFQKYVPRVREFLLWSLRRGATFNETREVDEEMADFFEEAFNYIANKGYKRMPKEEEDEWMELMKSIHSSVKGGMRYNTGKLQMVLYRPLDQRSGKATVAEMD